MDRPSQKTRIICTIGPSSSSEEVLKRLMEVGMNLARLNFSHGTFDSHREVIGRIRHVAKRLERRVSIMADLPGPKMRIGILEEEPVELHRGSEFVLTTRKVPGTREMVSVSIDWLPKSVRPGQRIFLNDGLIELEVQRVVGEEIVCKVIVGGELRSKKGINVPGIDLGQGAFTEKDREWLKFAIEQGVDAVSQSFVGSAKDVEDVRRAARELGGNPFVIAKIERSSVLERIDEVVDAADGIMVARGDLGVEIPIYEIAIAQKGITWRAHAKGKPVITATQMLESMTHNRRPTRAEATDVANAILDGTDCVMLSEESATGSFPVEAAQTLARIAQAIEPYIERPRFKWMVRDLGRTGAGAPDLMDTISESVDSLVDRLDVAAVICPTESGHTARMVTRFRLPCWVLAISNSQKTCQELMFSYGVIPIYVSEKPAYWGDVAGEILRAYGLEGDYTLLTEGPSRAHPGVDHRIEIISHKKS